MTFTTISSTTSETGFAAKAPAKSPSASRQSPRVTPQVGHGLPVIDARMHGRWIKRLAKKQIATANSHKVYDEFFRRIGLVIAGKDPICQQDLLAGVF